MPIGMVRQDINSGIVVHAGLFGPTVHTGYGLPVRLNVMLPFAQKPLSGRGDSFEPGPYSLSYRFAGVLSNKPVGGSSYSRYGSVEEASGYKSTLLRRRSRHVSEDLVTIRVTEFTDCPSKEQIVAITRSLVSN